MALVSDRRLTHTALAVAIVTAALGYALGVIGFGVAAIVAIVGVVTSAVYAFGVGQLLFAVLATTVAGGLPDARLLGGQLGLGAFLLFALVEPWPRRTAAIAALMFGLAATGLATVYALETLWHGAVLLAAIYALTAYTLHRYELVRLDLITEADA
ncbi:hypothetical protein HWV07_06745 [Natronomonas salina]|uniref:hypothetical protein n=1 Tax=Natronomonas salina TaxID=1710540 RepID=UPI0015B603E0|nr:hypothetical protein [Natronomonas salina]QLD88748.1 hypothetical protein HWV07_06745 [Natronomonas salina]